MSGPLTDLVSNQVLFSGVTLTNTGQLNSTATIVLLICAALVLFMVPGLAIFYGGLVRKKNVTTIMAQCFISIAIVTFIWIFGGFSLAFGSDLGGVIGNPWDYFFFRNVICVGNDLTKVQIMVNATFASGVPFIAFYIFQLAFAIITPALVTGAFADRLNYRGYIIFTVLFTLFIYIPVCHWIWGGGWLMKGGAIDWAGGIVIHATCGAAAIASVTVLKKRSILSNESIAPHSLPLVAIGAAILFFGWFGFNTGSATYMPTYDLAGNSTVAYNGDALLSIGLTAFTNCVMALVTAIIIWTIMDLIFKRKTSLTSILTAGVAGLATVTPGAGYIPIWGGLIFGAIGGLVCNLMCMLNHKTHFDDALEVWPVHGVGGVLGGFFVSVFAMNSVNPIGLGTINGFTKPIQMSSLHLLASQLIAIVVVCVSAFIVSIIIFLLIYLLHGKVDPNQQNEGLDHVLFNEDAYSKGVIGVNNNSNEPIKLNRALIKKTAFENVVENSSTLTNEPKITKKVKKTPAKKSSKSLLEKEKLEKLKQEKILKQQELEKIKLEKLKQEKILKQHELEKIKLERSNKSPAATKKSSISKSKATKKTTKK